jgi:hypothetical protein
LRKGGIEEMAGGRTVRPSDVVEYRSNGRILSRDNAIAIFKLRAVPPADSEGDEGGGTAEPGRSGAVAKKFGVSPKTVRDVWNKTTWVEGFFSPLLHAWCQECGRLFAHFT